MRSANLSWLWRGAIDRAAQILDEFDVMPMAIEVSHHEGGIGDAGDRLLPVSVTRRNRSGLETQHLRPEPHRLVHVRDGKAGVVESRDHSELPRGSHRRSSRRSLPACAL